MGFIHFFSLFPRMLAVSAFSLLVTSNFAQADDPETTCEMAKLKAAGKKADCLAKEEAKAILGKPSNPAKCEAAFTRAFAKAEAAAAKAGGACPVTGDVTVIEDLVDTCVADIAATIAGMNPPSCARFPATGQTMPYTADKNDGVAGEVAVPDDGLVRAGAPLSYTDNGDGTITDNNTGLMWEKKINRDGAANFADLHDADNLYRWSGNGSQETIWDWLDDLNAEGGTGYAGHNDWRIPNVKELVSLLDLSREAPAIAPIFSQTAALYYMSSTTFENSVESSRVWLVDFDHGYVLPNNKIDAELVRAVRGGS